MIFKIQLYFFNIIFRLFKVGYPFGIMKWANKDVYKKLFENIKYEKYPDIDNFEKKLRFKIDSNFLNDLALETQIVIKKSKLNFQHGRVLYSLISEMISKTEFKNKFNILETGTARGFSTICMSKALLDQNQKGSIDTIDILPHYKKIIWNCILDHEGMKSRNSILGKWKNELNLINFYHGTSRNIFKKLIKSRYHFCFLDSSHKYSDVKLEYDWIKLRQETNDIIVLDDYTPYVFDGVVKLVEDIKKENIYNLEILYSTKDRGYAILQKK